MSSELIGSGDVARKVNLPRWRLLYLIERGDLPGPSFEVPGRRLFTPEDVVRIDAVLRARPDLLKSGEAESDCGE